LGDRPRSEQLSIALVSQGVNAGEVVGQIAPSTKSHQELSESLPVTEKLLCALVSVQCSSTKYLIIKYFGSYTNYTW